jgi:hypothetical protein
MLRSLAVALPIVFATALAGCGGDDSFDPTNPDASSAVVKSSDAASDAPHDHQVDAAHETDAGTLQEAGGDT